MAGWLAQRRLHADVESQDGRTPRQDAPAPGKSTRSHSTYSGSVPRALTHSVYFDHNADVVGAAEAAGLDSYLRRLAALKPKGIHLLGHASAAGAARYNEALAQRRCRSVVSRLHLSGHRDVPVTVEAVGETGAVAGGKSAQQRRVDIIATIDSQDDLACESSTLAAHPQASVYFSTDSSRLDADDRYLVDRAITRIGADKTVILVGMTDASGAADYNRMLARRRCQSVLVAMRARGLTVPVLWLARGEVGAQRAHERIRRRVDVFVCADVDSDTAREARPLPEPSESQIAKAADTDKIAGETGGRLSHADAKAMWNRVLTKDGYPSGLRGLMDRRKEIVRLAELVESRTGVAHNPFSHTPQRASAYWASLGFTAIGDYGRAHASLSELARSLMGDSDHASQIVPLAPVNQTSYNIPRYGYSEGMPAGTPLGQHRDDIHHDHARGNIVMASLDGDGPKLGVAWGKASDQNSYGVAATGSRHGGTLQVHSYHQLQDEPPFHGVSPQLTAQTDDDHGQKVRTAVLGYRHGRNHTAGLGPLHAYDSDVGHHVGARFEASTLIQDGQRGVVGVVDVTTKEVAAEVRLAKDTPMVGEQTDHVHAGVRVPHGNDPEAYIEHDIAIPMGENIVLEQATGVEFDGEFELASTTSATMVVGKRKRWAITPRVRVSTRGVSMSVDADHIDPKTGQRLGAGAELNLENSRPRLSPRLNAWRLLDKLV